ncbi:MFS transporter [Brevibacillus fluminis]|uniref:MFS transporter n=1 Tax=Brevibacillus fluminis TaxID=511487 RepID=UPI003F89C604
MNDRITMPIWAGGNFLVVMNTTMFNVSLPTVIDQLHITAGLGSWIVSGYSIMFALATIIFSRLSDFIPIRKLISIGLLLLGISSVLGYAADSFGVVLLARLLQASGAGAMPGLGMVLASRYVPYERRGRAISMIASGSALAFGLGPVIGGAITQYLGWHELFLVTCLVIGLIPVLWRLLPKEAQKPVGFDFVGAGLTVIASAALLLAITQLSLLYLLVGAAALFALIRQLRKAERPFIHPALFGNAGYRKLVMIAFLVFILNMSMLFLMPLILATVFAKGAATIGMVIFPGAIFSAVLMKWVGRWIDRYGNFRFLLGGQLVLGAAMLLLATMLHASMYIVLAAYVLFAPSLSAVTSALSNEISRILPKELIGSGMGLSQLSQYLGGSFAVAVCGLLMVWQKEMPPANAFQHIYLLLIAVLAIALGLLYQYRKSQYPLKRTPQQDLQQVSN